MWWKKKQNWSKRDTYVFLTGASAFHTFSHIVIYAMGMLPLEMNFMTLTIPLNSIVIILNTILTLWLLRMARRAQ